MMALGALACGGPAAAQLSFLPERSLFPSYLADPRRPTFGVQTMWTRPSGFFLKHALGTHRPVFHYPLPGGELELTAWAGTWSRFDLREKWDMLAQDFRVGGGVAYRRGDWAVRVHNYHESDHLGDEYMARTGARPIGYRREDAGVAVSRWWGPGFRAYAEGGVGYYVGHAHNERYRLQSGMEWEQKRPPGARAHAYGALNITGKEEAKWRPAPTVQGGVVFWNDQRSRAIRLHLTFHTGPETLGEFFDRRIRYMALGFSVDM